MKEFVFKAVKFVASLAYHVTFILIAVLAICVAVSYFGEFTDHTPKLLESMGDMIDSLVVFMVVILWLDRK